MPLKNVQILHANMFILVLFWSHLFNFGEAVVFGVTQKLRFRFRLP